MKHLFYNTKTSKEAVFSRRHEAMCDSSGRADAASVLRGPTIARRTVNRAWSACPHTLTGALRSGAPPDGEQIDLLADESAPFGLCGSGQRSPQESPC